MSNNDSPLRARGRAGRPVVPRYDNIQELFGDVSTRLIDKMIPIGAGIARKTACMDIFAETKAALLRGSEHDGQPLLDGRIMFELMLATLSAEEALARGVYGWEGQEKIILPHEAGWDRIYAEQHGEFYCEVYCRADKLQYEMKVGITRVGPPRIRGLHKTEKEK